MTDMVVTGNPLRDPKKIARKYFAISVFAESEAWEDLRDSRWTRCVHNHAHAFARSSARLRAD